jgi:hypothetical protein
MADMSWRGGWSSVTVVGEYMGPCNYEVEIDFDVMTDDPLAQNTAYNRMKYLFESIYQDNVLICLDNPLVPVLKKMMRSQVIVFPLEPLDMIVAGVSWYKLHNICESHIQLERIRISSDQSDDCILNITDDFMKESKGLSEDLFLPYGKPAWWFRSDFGVEDWIENVDGKLQAHYSEEAWPEFLQWDWRPEDTEHNDKNNVVKLDKKWKPEVIKGDKT